MNKGRNHKPHLGIFGRRNTGKSSLINVLVNQEIAIVSDTPGTTTDPVKKSLEIFGIGPVIVIDTAGIDDTGILGMKRIEKTREVIMQVDSAVLMIAGNEFGEFETNLIREFEYWQIPYLIIHNKCDLQPLTEETVSEIDTKTGHRVLAFSAVNPYNLGGLIELLNLTFPETSYNSASLISDLVDKRDYVLLITPIDLEAPEGRMILPQVMTIRDVLDNDCINIVLKETEVAHFLATSGIMPRLAITDSQVFGKMKNIIPEGIPLTGFSIVMARHNGFFDEALKGTPTIDLLQNGDRILILESCSHQVNCDDIGRYKIPSWIRRHTGRDLDFDIIAGLSRIEKDITEYALVIQCGGCMATRRQLLNRIMPAIRAGIPVTNYGMAIAWMNGIFERAVEPFMKINV